MAEYDQGNIDDIEGHLGAPVDISGIKDQKDIEEINGIAFELYKESSILLSLIANMVESHEDEVRGVPRNQAICIGLIIQITKLMLGVVQLSATRNRGEIVQLLNRGILEPAINLEFLIMKDADEHYDRFVAYSFGPERELYDEINANIALADGSVKPIETRMLQSIAEKCRISKVNIDEVPLKHREWATSMRDRLKTIDRTRLYIVYRSLSHSVHGSWMQMLQHNLDYDDATGLFTPLVEMTDVDARILLPVATTVLEAAQKYLVKFFTPIPTNKHVFGRISNLLDRIYEVDAAHEKLYSELHP